MNEDIRCQYKNVRVYVSEVANRLGIGESTFYKMMRQQLTPQQRRRILNAIDDVKIEKFQSLGE